MKLFNNELVTKMEKKVAVNGGIISISDEIEKAMETSIGKYNMAHGSHKQHSSSGEYGKCED